MAGDAVEADDRRRLGIAPLVQVQQHRTRLTARYFVRSSRCARVTSRRSKRTRSRTRRTTISDGPGVAGALKCRRRGRSSAGGRAGADPRRDGGGDDCGPARCAVRDPRRRHGPGPHDGRGARPADDCACVALRTSSAASHWRFRRSAPASALPLAECARSWSPEARAFEATSLRRVIFAVYGDAAARSFSGAAAA